MKIIIVLAVHGTPPRDFPREELAEFFRLHSHIGEDKSRVSGQDRYSFLNNKGIIYLTQGGGIVLN